MNGPVSDMDCGLRDTVHVDQPRAPVPPFVDPGYQASWVECLATKNDKPQRQRLVVYSGNVHQLPERRWCLIENRHMLTAKQTQEILRRSTYPERHHDKGSARTQRTKYLPDREIKGVGVKECPNILTVEVEPFICRSKKPIDVPMAHLDTLGSSSGSRGIDDICKAVHIQSVSSCIQIPFWIFRKHLHIIDPNHSSIGSRQPLQKA